MQVKLQGIHAVNRIMKNGTRKNYFYAWRGGPRLPSPDDPEFLRSYQRAIDAKAAGCTSDISSLIRSYKESSWFRFLSTASIKAYGRHLELIANEFGSYPLTSLEHPTIRGEFLRWRDRFSATPRKADYAWMVLVRLMSHAVNQGLASHNPCLRAGRLYRGSRKDAVWSDVDLRRLRKFASKEIWAAVQFAFWTGQRQGDLLNAQWADVSKGRICFRQSKTGARVCVPLSSALAQTFSSLDQTTGHILVSSRGEPWTSDGFRTSFRCARDRAGLSHLTFHDLRGTAITRMALAGCTAIQIAAITGHSSASVSQILSKHYIGAPMELADIAMKKFSAAYLDLAADKP